MSTMRRNLASRSRGLRGEGVTAEMSRRAGTGAPGIGSGGSYWFSTQADNVLALQLLLVTISVPLMFLATPGYGPRDNR